MALLEGNPHPSEKHDQALDVIISALKSMGPGYFFDMVKRRFGYRFDTDSNRINSERTVRQIYDEETDDVVNVNL